MRNALALSPPDELVGMTSGLPPRSDEAPVEQALPVSAHSAVTARELAVERCARWGRPSLCDDVALVVTELVSNAVKHARTPLVLRLSPIAGGVRVEVGDDSLRPVRRREAAPLDEGGRGLLLVDALAHRWSVEAQPEGKRVWAELLEDAASASLGPSR